MGETETRPLDIILAAGHLARLGGYDIPELFEAEREAAEGRFDVESVRAASNALRWVGLSGSVVDGNWMLADALYHAWGGENIELAEAALAEYATASSELDNVATFVRDGTSVRRALDIDALLAQGS